MSGIMEQHGGSVITMKGKSCVAIACDLRLGQNALTNIATNVNKVHFISDKVYVGVTGFNADCATVLNKLRAHQAIYEMREQRPMSPKVLTSYLSWLLYKRRFGPFFINPVVAGLDEQNEAYISHFDVIGAITEPEDYAVEGSGGDLAMSLCEAFWRPDMSPEELTVAVGQAMLAVVQRDASTGWGILVYTITADGMTKKLIKSRMD